MIQSYDVPLAKYDHGREHMKIMIAEKQRQAAQRAACLRDGSCPRRYTSFGYTPCQGNMAGPFPCRNIDIMSFVDIKGLGYDPPHPDDKLPEGNDIWGWTDPLTGDEWAIMGLTGGSSFVKITDPSNPVTVAFLRTRNGPSTWRDMKVIQNTAYIVSEDEDHGLQVFDLERLRSMTSFAFVEADTLYSEFGNAHNIVANEETKFLYVVGATQSSYPGSCSGGLHVIDVSDRLNPKFAGCFPDDGYVHDAQCIIYHGPDTRYQGKEICLCFNEDTFTIVDVSDKSRMTLVSKKGYSGYLYTHQGWITDDHKLVLLDDEMDEYLGAHTKTYLWDVTDLRDPILKHRFSSSQTAIDHNQYVKDGFTFQANYQAGLRILHILQESFNLNEVAYLDVYPAETKVKFTGSWSVYPYYPSGNVVVSSIDYGLFVVRPNYEAMKAQAKTVYAEQKRSRSLLKTSSSCPNMEEFRQCKCPRC
jgi:choice-of-anchor B domain-containing protein